jgi:hypothetical protein
MRRTSWIDRRIKSWWLASAVFLGHGIIGAVNRTGFAGDRLV